MSVHTSAPRALPDPAYWPSTVPPKTLEALYAALAERDRAEHALRQAKADELAAQTAARKAERDARNHLAGHAPAGPDAEQLQAATEARQAAEDALHQATEHAGVVWREALAVMVGTDLTTAPLDIDTLTENCDAEAARAEYLQALADLEAARAKYDQTLAAWRWFATLACIPLRSLRHLPHPHTLPLQSLRYSDRGPATTNRTTRDALAALQREGSNAPDATAIALVGTAHDWARKVSGDVAELVKARLSDATHQRLEADKDARARERAFVASTYKQRWH